MKLQHVIKKSSPLNEAEQPHVVVDLAPSLKVAIKGKTEQEACSIIFDAINNYFDPNHMWSLEGDEWNTKMSSEQKTGFVRTYYRSLLSATPQQALTAPPAREEEEQQYATKYPSTRRARRVFVCPYCGSDHHNDGPGFDIKCCGEVGHCIDDSPAD